MPKFQARTQTLFHIRLRSILLKSTASLFIWCPKIPRYCFSVSYTAITQNSGRKILRFGKKCQSASEKLHSALYTFAVADKPNTT